MVNIISLRSFSRASLSVLLFACAPQVASLGGDASGGDASGGSTGTATGSGGFTQFSATSTGTGRTTGGSRSQTGGATSTVLYAVIADGESNKASTGGYIWTFVDRSGKSAVFPFTGKVNPRDPLSNALNPGLGFGNGIADDGTGNLAFHVIGTVAAAPTWTATLGESSDWADPYWDAAYGSTCVGGKCLEVAYPEAGIGLSLRAGNAPMDLSRYLGIAFRLKAGSTHGHDSANDGLAPITIQAVSELTDVPDPSLGDEFGDATTGQRVPFCTFPGTELDDETAVGNANKTCFGHYEKQVVPSDTWTQTCLNWSRGWSDFQAPAWVVAAATNSVPPGSSVPVFLAPESTRLTKFRWGAYRPSSVGTNTTFDFWLDDVVLLTCENWEEYCSNDVRPASCLVL